MNLLNAGIWASCGEIVPDAGTVSCAEFTPPGTEPINAFPTTLQKLLDGQLTSDAGVCL